MRRLEECDVYLSTTERLPNAENCEQHIKGLHSSFRFGSPEGIRWPLTKKNPNIKLYFTIVYGQSINEPVLSDVNSEESFSFDRGLSTRINSRQRLDDATFNFMILA